jgi:hypothetical protein
MACYALKPGIYIRLILFAALLSLMGACTNSKLSREDIKIAAADLRSYAAAARMLAEQHRSGSTTEIFFQSQTDMFREKIDDERKGLEANGGENEIYRLRVSEVANRLDSLLGPSGDEAGFTRCLEDARTVEEALNR